MTSVQLLVKLNGEALDPKSITEFEFVSSEDRDYPMGILKISDPNGTTLAHFNGLEAGAKVEISFYSTGDQFDWSVADLVVASFSVPISDLSSYGGEINILLTHPWQLYKDYSAHAYKGKSHSKIIKGLLEDSSQRGFKFDEINDDNFLDSDEKGTIPRYKCMESDFDFIKNKLLPYTTVKGESPIFWVDEYNSPHLNSFTNMYKNTPKCVIIPDEASFAGEHSDELQKLLPKNGEKVVTFSNALIKMGDEDIDKFVKVVKPKVFYTNTMNNKIFAGLSKIAVAITKDGGIKGKVDGSRIPLGFEAMMNLKATDNLAFINRNTDDVTALSKNLTSHFNQFFRIELTCNFCGDIVQTGDNIYLMTNKIKDQFDPLKVGKVVHWMGDKWHVYGVRHNLDIENQTVKTTLLLCRPSFIVNTKNTSIKDINAFYGVS